MTTEHITNNKNIVVLGIYPSYETLELAVDSFRLKGFRNADISALMPSNETTKQLTHSKSTKAPERAAAGSVAGVTVGGALGWLAGIGSLAIPGAGPLIAAGPIMGLLAGAATGGTLGGVLGGLAGLGVPEYEAKRYDGRVSNGGYLLTVHCDDKEWKDMALEVFKSTGAEDVSSTEEAGSEDSVNKNDKPRPIVGNY